MPGSGFRSSGWTTAALCSLTLAVGCGGTAPDADVGMTSESLAPQEPVPAVCDPTTLCCSAGGYYLNPVKSSCDAELLRAGCVGLSGSGIFASAVAASKYGLPYVAVECPKVSTFESCTPVPADAISPSCYRPSSRTYLYEAPANEEVAYPWSPVPVCGTCLKSQ